MIYQSFNPNLDSISTLTERDILRIKADTARRILNNIPAGQFAEFRATMTDKLAAAQKALAEYDAAAADVIPEHQSSARLYRTFEDVEMDGSNTSMAAQLTDAGFGSHGVI